MEGPARFDTGQYRNQVFLAYGSWFDAHANRFRRCSPKRSLYLYGGRPNTQS